MFNKSIIVCAHPDDEILWCSSILDEVDEILFCFLDIPSSPSLTLGRKKSLSEYPMENISCLGMVESEAFFNTNWHYPVNTQYGIKISMNKIKKRKYEENYYKLKQYLEEKLAGFLNVFTPNPWGDYGHVEHVQLYRVIKELQGKMGFNLWYSNYCSVVTFNLMLRYVSGFNSEYITLKTNKTLAYEIKDLYIKNKCWTWYDDWEWFNEESFMKDGIINIGNKSYGHIFPLNMIKGKPRIKLNWKSSILQTHLVKRLRNQSKKMLSPF